MLSARVLGKKPSRYSLRKMISEEKNVSISAYFEIDDGKVDDFKLLATQVSDRVKLEEPGTIHYAQASRSETIEISFEKTPVGCELACFPKFYFNGNMAICREIYEDAKAFLGIANPNFDLIKSQQTNYDGWHCWGKTITRGGHFLH